MTHQSVNTLGPTT